MRKLLSLVLALGLLLGVAGTAMANCGAGHTEAGTNPPTQPLPQS
jgi:hypothetical protein